MEQQIIKMWNLIRFWTEGNYLFNEEKDNNKNALRNSIKLKSITCKNCGAQLIKSDNSSYICEYCGTRYVIDE